MATRNVNDLQIFPYNSKVITCTPMSAGGRYVVNNGQNLVNVIKERPPNRKAKFNDFFFIVCFAICDEASRVGLSQLSHTVHASLREQKKNHFHTVSFHEVCVLPTFINVLLRN